MPEYVLDVTIPIRFASENNILETSQDGEEQKSEAKKGLRLRKNRANLVGFFNPIPECLSIQPVLCLVYKQQ